MNLLAIDTSTRATVLGLQLGDEVIDRTTPEVRTHSRDILPSIVSLLDETGTALTQLDAIVFGRGPGSFTGLRIAVGVVQGLAYGADIPVVPVSSMRCLAQSVSEEAAEGVFVALEARLEEIYFGAYRIEQGLAVSAAAEGVLDVSDLPELEGAAWMGIGNGWLLRDKIERATGVMFSSVVERSVPGIHDLLRLGLHELGNGNTVTALEAVPVYLREEVAERPAKGKLGQV